MGLRRRMYRLSRSHKVWAGTVVVCVLYVSLLHVIFTAESAEREGKQSQRVVPEMKTDEETFNNVDGERGRTAEGVTGYEYDIDGDGGERALDSNVVDNHDNNEHDRNYSVNYDKDKDDDDLKNDDENYDDDDSDDIGSDDDEDGTGDGRNNDIDDAAAAADGDDNNAASHNDAADGDDNNAAAHIDAADGDDSNAAAHNAAVDGDDNNAASHNDAADGDDNNAASHNDAADGDDNNAAAHIDAADGDDSNAAAHNAAVDGGDDSNAAAHNAAVDGGDDNNAAAHNAAVDGGDDNNAAAHNDENENNVAIKHNMNKNKDVGSVSINKLKPDIKPGIGRDEDGEIEVGDVKPEVQGMNVEDTGAHGNEPVGVDPEDADHRAAGNQLTYDGYYNRNETFEHKPVVKVILLTYQRSGSSYVGELLTSGGGAMYVFEPLFVWRKVLGPEADARVQADSARVLGDLLDCRREVIHAWHRKGFYYFRRKPDGAKNFCHDARLRLLKTIRARARFVRPWIQERPDVKVVHLVRDPRGVISSVQRGGGMWSENNRNVDLQCSNIEEDLQLEDLGPNRYLRVRYEDLVDHPLEETRRVFAFMGIDVSQGVMTYLQQHAGLGQPPAEEQGYLNTYRGSSYRHDHWKAHLDNREMEYIQQVCRGVMGKLGYTPLPPT